MFKDLMGWGELETREAAAKKVCKSLTGTFNKVLGDDGWHT